jgi:dCTP deaminase
MGMLTGAEIQQQVASGRIKIQDFDPRYLNPNSYDVALAPKLLVYKPRRWYTPWRKPLVWGAKNPPDEIITMPTSGYMIRPGWFYLGSTVEYTETQDYVPAIDGRSSGGRLSLHIHATAGFGDIGFTGVWTLELYSIIPVWVFPYARVAQLSYQTVQGEIRDKYQGRYGGAVEAVCAQEEQPRKNPREWAILNHLSVKDYSKKEG